MIRVGIVGALGYGGREFMRLIVGHPEATLTAAVTREGGRKVAEVLPAFGKFIDLTLESFDAKSLAERCDVVFLAVPGTQSMALGAELYDSGVCVMDLGSDFRIKDPVAYTQYYKQEYTRPELARDAVYGHVPWYREQLKSARLVAVPGCFPISILTPLRALIDAAAPGVPVVVNSVSGVSGAGKGLSDVFHFPAMNENVKAYKLGIHQHIPEIEQELGGNWMVQFTPHVAPVTRGILSTIVLRPSRDIDPASLLARYDNEPFVRVLPEGQIPDLNHVRGSNFCDMGFKRDERTGNIVLVSVIDNLCGGTAGMGIQCMNVAFGIDERAGLMLPGMAPMTPPIEMGICAPKGFTASAVAAGIKNPAKPRADCALLVSDTPAAMAGTFTTNKVRAACVRWNEGVRERGHAQALFVNSGNANACTGEKGDQDVHDTAARVAAQLGIAIEDVLVASTGGYWGAHADGSPCSTG